MCVGVYVVCVCVCEIRFPVCVESKDGLDVNEEEGVREDIGVYVGCVCVYMKCVYVCVNSAFLFLLKTKMR